MREKRIERLLRHIRQRIPDRRGEQLRVRAPRCPDTHSRRQGPSHPPACQRRWPARPSPADCRPARCCSSSSDRSRAHCPWSVRNHAPSSMQPLAQQAVLRADLIGLVLFRRQHARGDTQAQRLCRRIEARPVVEVDAAMRVRLEDKRRAIGRLRAPSARSAQSPRVGAAPATLVGGA